MFLPSFLWKDGRRERGWGLKGNNVHAKFLCPFSSFVYLFNKFTQCTLFLFNPSCLPSFHKKRASALSRERKEDDVIMRWTDLDGHQSFQLKCCFWGQLAIGDISTHRPIFAMPLLPPARVYYKGAATKKNGGKGLRVDDFSVLLLTIFN